MKAILYFLAIFTVTTLLFLKSDLYIVLSVFISFIVSCIVFVLLIKAINKFMGSEKKLLPFEDDNSKVSRENKLKAYIYNTEYMKELRQNEILLLSYIEHIKKTDKDIDHSVEIFARTIAIEAISRSFDVEDFQKYLFFMAHDIFSYEENLSVCEMVEFFQKNIMSYFLNETRVNKFSQVYFIEDCFRLICYLQAKE